MVLNFFIGLVWTFHHHGFKTGSVAVSTAMLLS